MTIVVNQAGFYGIPRKIARVRAEKYLRQLQLWDKRNGPARGLSGGMKRRLMVAKAMVHNPPVLILDEPTSGLDPEQQREARQLIASLAGDHTIILSTHILSEVEQSCSKVIIINDGQIVAVDSVANLHRRRQGGEICLLYTSRCV